jgi:hypothetical protein
MAVAAIILAEIINGCANDVFEPLRHLQDLDFFGNVIACDRDYYDGENHLAGPNPCMPLEGKDGQR